ncbi:hypothetical protein QR680_007593 [Steinernema hermaphroditum]|uniref:glutathione transferase n=1 Tax=Steinernema hermaphroditum TaxID=289476 RepID=A0AA39IFU5_9BILA|nr:hypothetical protein QR680_007593 [Steinernema hermaphroditum]
MPTYKLYYFQGRGRAEHIRQIFKLAGKEFEDVVLTHESWPSYKDDMPLYQVPVLEVDGVKIGQTLAISRFLGRQFGMAGKNDLEAAKIDMLGDLIQDLSVADGVKEWPVQEDYFREKVRPQIEKFAPLVEKFLLGNGLLVGDNVTWVDVFAAEYFSKFVDYGEKDCLEAYPRLLELVARIHNIPAIKKHIEERPATLA